MMQPSLSVCLAVIAFISYTLNVLIVLRLARSASPAMMVCVNAILVYVIGLLTIGFYGSHINFFTFSSVYWFFAISLLMYFGAIYKSISLRMMQHLLCKPNKSDYSDILLESYIQNQSYSQRVEILLKNGMLHKNENSTLTLTKKGNTLAKLTCVIQNIFSIKDSG